MTLDTRNQLRINFKSKFSKSKIAIFIVLFESFIFIE